MLYGDVVTGGNYFIIVCFNQAGAHVVHAMAQLC